MTKFLSANLNFVQHGRVEHVGGASTKASFAKYSTLTNFAEVSDYTVHTKSMKLHQILLSLF